jgi:hypothetical protein
MVLPKRQREEESAPSARSALHPNAAAVSFYQTFGDRQTYAPGAMPRRIAVRDAYLKEPLENQRPVFLGDPRTFILDIQPDRVSILGEKAYRNVPPFRRKSYSVGYQVRQDLVDPLSIKGKLEIFRGIEH